MHSPAISVKQDITQEHILSQKNSDSFAIKSSRVKERYPEISVEILDAAIKQDILPISYKDKLITNPNKYSVFFAKFDLNSPTTKQALSNLNLHEDDATTLSYYEFSSQSFNTLKNVVSYLYYLTERYNTLKTIINERNRLKKDQQNQAKLRNLKLYTSSGYDNEFDNEYDQSQQVWGQSSELNHRAKQLNSPKFNNSTSQLLNKSRTLKTIDEKKSIQKSKYGKYGEVVQFVRHEKIDNLVAQRKYEEADIITTEKKMAQRQLIIQKQVEKRQKELSIKFKNAQDKIKRNLERQELLVEKRLIEMDANGEKYEEMKRIKEEKRQKELMELKELGKKQLAMMIKKREQREQEDWQKRVSLTHSIERKENNAENIVRRLKGEHDQRFSQLNQKYDETISNSLNLKENFGNLNIQKLCENEAKRIQKTEEREKTNQKNIKLKKQEFLKRQEKLNKFLENNQLRNENKIDKMKEKIHNKFIRIDQVNDIQTEKSVSLSATNSRRHEKVHKNFASELYKYALLQEKVVKKHTDIDQRNEKQSNSLSGFFSLTRSLSQDLFAKREDQFNNIK